MRKNLRTRKGNRLPRLLSLVGGCIMLVLFAQTAVAQANSVKFRVGLELARKHYYRVEMDLSDVQPDSLVLTMPAWTPGYYQMLDFAHFVEGLKVVDEAGKSLEVAKRDKHSWAVALDNAREVRVSYLVRCDRAFVATPWIDKERAYLIPGALFLYPNDELSRSVDIDLEPAHGWKDVATGLEERDSNPFHLRAANYDVLYDSPILIGNLEHLPSFEVRGIPHYFVGHKMGDFDQQVFMDDLKKLVETAVDLIGDIPYDHYTFIGIGPGRGGLEHLNSTAVSFDGNGLNNRSDRLRMLSFLTHEYFHHFNVKRIRPIELGPFDYTRENRTNLLWVSEGLTVYYEYLIMKRAGLFTEQDLLHALNGDLLSYQRKPGRFFQTLAESSAETWSDGPFGRVDDEVNKTISYYQKGPVIGWLFDFKIREATDNQKSLDDVMRELYNNFYLKKERGFTEDELRVVLEKTAGEPLDSLFQYIYTTQQVDYNKYLAVGGYEVDTVSREVPGAWFGATVQSQGNHYQINSVEWKSPAWEAGVRRGQLVQVSGTVATSDLAPMLAPELLGKTLHLKLERNGTTENVDVPLRVKKVRSYEISSRNDLTNGQTELRQKWLDGAL